MNATAWIVVAVLMGSSAAAALPEQQKDEEQQKPGLVEQQKKKEEEEQQKCASGESKEEWERRRGLTEQQRQAEWQECMARSSQRTEEAWKAQVEELRKRAGGLHLVRVAPPCRLEERLAGVVVGKMKGPNRYEVAQWTYGDSGPCVNNRGHPISCRPPIVLGEHVLLSAKRAHGENEDILVCIDPKKTRTVKVVANSGFSRWIKAYVER